MSRPLRQFFKLLVFTLVIPGAFPGRAPAQPAADPAMVKLPPMIVEDSKDKPRWLYVKAGDTEYLSLCSTGVTERYVRSREHMMQLVHVLVPESFLLHLDAPATMVLYSQDNAKTATADAVRAMLAAHSGPDSSNFRLGPGSGFFPNMRLDDRDTHASFAYVDESRFDAGHIIVAENHLHYLMENRVPLLPAWLIEAVDATYQDSDFIVHPITLKPLRWIDSFSTNDLVRRDNRPRVMLSAVELFAPDSLRGDANHHPRRVAALQSEAALFFRWAFETGPDTRDALWKFVGRATEETITEEMFEECFGFGYSELRDRLSDYLVHAVREVPRIEPGKLPALPRVSARDATPNEIARIRGEWERMAIDYVREKLPDYREPYLSQARRTLHRAYDTGDRDPRLLATMGLCELDNGDAAAARPFLEPAMAAGVVRPRVYYELARLQFTALKRDQPPTLLFTYAELAAVLEPLRRAARLAPAMPEVFGLFAEAWVRCKSAPDPGDLAILQQGARYFSRRGNIGFPLALALARHGHRAEAEAVLALGFDYLLSEEQRARYTQLRAELNASPVK